MASPSTPPKMKGPRLSVSLSGKPQSAQSEHERYKMAWEKEVGPSTLPFRTQKTSVLLLSWTPDHDDLKVGHEIESLHQVFEELYKFKVYKKLLDPDKPQQQALMDLATFVHAEDTKRALLIIYYAGHGHGANVISGDMRLEGQKSPNVIHDARQSIVWSQVEPAIRDTEGDVLLIFDCCNAGRLALPIRRNPGPKSSFQFLGACSEDQTTMGPGEESFTTALIWALKELGQKDKAFSTADLRDKITQYERFPRHLQIPVLSNRRPPHWHIIISKQKSDSDKAVSPSPSPSVSSELEPIVHKDHIDLRFHFEHKVEEEHVKEAGEAINRLMRAPVPWSRVTFLSKSSILEKYANLWMEGRRARSGSKDGRLLTPTEQPHILTEQLCTSPIVDPVINLKVPVPPLPPATVVQRPQDAPNQSYGNGAVVSPKTYTNRNHRVDEEPISFHVRAIATKLQLILSATLAWLSYKLNPCSDYERIPDEESQ